MRRDHDRCLGDVARFALPSRLVCRIWESMGALRPVSQGAVVRSSDAVDVSRAVPGDAPASTQATAAAATPDRAEAPRRVAREPSAPGVAGALATPKRTDAPKSAAVRAYTSLQQHYRATVRAVGTFFDDALSVGTRVALADTPQRLFATQGASDYPRRVGSRVLRVVDFTDAELASMRAAVAKADGILRCEELAPHEVVRTNLIRTDDPTSPEVVAGIAIFPERVIAIADAAKHLPGGVGFTVLHELGHSLLQSTDPRTCTEYERPEDNPLMREWEQAAGWERDGTLRAGEQVTRDYARTNAREDMAESFATYVLDRPKLEAVSPARARFFDRLFADLHQATTSS